MRKHGMVCMMVLSGVALLGGCVAGYNSMLFATKTNAALVVDTQTPEVSLDIGRQEGLLAPTYEAGKTPPVMASFRFDSGGGLLSNYIGSAFTTGDAAVTMSRLYDTKDADGITKNGTSVWDNTKESWRDIEKRFDSGVDLYLGEPKMPWFVPKEEAGAVRPVLFGTDTALGFKIAWKNPETPYPDYIRLGYQRRELAFAAVTVGPDDQNVKKLLENPGTKNEKPWLVARVPSLLATVDTKVHMGKFLNSGFNYLQYFASGSAATALAMREGVRRTMLHRLDPGQTVEGEEVYLSPSTAIHRGCISNWILEENTDERRAKLRNFAGVRDNPALAMWLPKATPDKLCSFIVEQGIECYAAGCGD